jgi:hypothetical protein
MGGGPSAGGWESAESEAITILVGGPILLLMIGGPILLSPGALGYPVLFGMLSLILLVGAQRLLFRRGFVSRSFAFDGQAARAVVERALAAAAVPIVAALPAKRGRVLVKSSVVYRVGEPEGIVRIDDLGDSTCWLAAGRFHRTHDERLHEFIDQLARLARPAGLKRAGEGTETGGKIPVGYFMGWRRDAPMLALLAMTTAAIVGIPFMLFVPSLGPLLPHRLVAMLLWIVAALVPGVLYYRYRGPDAWRYLPVDGNTAGEVIAGAVRALGWRSEGVKTHQVKPGVASDSAIRIPDLRLTIRVESDSSDGCNVKLLGVTMENEPQAAALIATLTECLRPVGAAAEDAG